MVKYKKYKKKSEEYMKCLVTNLKLKTCFIVLLFLNKAPNAILIYENTVNFRFVEI